MDSVLSRITSHFCSMWLFWHTIQKPSYNICFKIDFRWTQYTLLNRANCYGMARTIKENLLMHRLYYFKVVRLVQGLSSNADIFTWNTNLYRCAVVYTLWKTFWNMVLHEIIGHGMDLMPCKQPRLSGSFIADAVPWNSWWRHQMETFFAWLAFMRGIHRSPVNSPHKGQWRGALMFPLICSLNNQLSKQS